MSEPVVSKSRERGPWRPRDWIVIGFLLVIAAAVLGAVANDEGTGGVIFAIAAIPGSLMVTIGVVAKAVEVGIRTARVEPSRPAPE